MHSINPINSTCIVVAYIQTAVSWSVSSIQPKRHELISPTANEMKTASHRVFLNGNFLI